MRALLSALLIATTGCTGWLSEPLHDDGESPRGGAGTQGSGAAIDLGKGQLRRLTRMELAATLTLAFGVAPGALIDAVPLDITSERGNPFDNDAALQDVATSYVQSLTTFAERYGDLVAAETVRVDGVAGCSPVRSDDAACYAAFVRSAGRVMLRREIRVDDLDRFAPLLAFGKEAGDYYFAIAAAVQALVQHPESVFRFELGSRVGASYVLDDYEIASRLAFLVWGAGPDDALLDAAERGELKDAAARKLHMARLFDDSRSRPHWRRFHAQWLGYDGRTPDTLAADLELETNTVIDAITHDDASLAWLDLYRLDKTYVTPALAAHYGMPAITKAGWATYDGKRGGGILAHGSFLQQGAKFGDTSPTLRGYRLWKRTFCGELGAPPIDVDTDNPPAGVSPTACKEERYSMRTDPACASCHVLTDGLGFGLENFGATGEWRDHEPQNASCEVSGDGVLGDVGYSGPAELGAIIAESADAANCAARQIFRFAAGRTETDDDEAAIATITSRITETSRFRDVLLAVVESEEFVHRKP